MKKTIAEVAIPVSLSLDRSFDYLVAGDDAQHLFVGSRVLVPFRQKTFLGFVTRIKHRSAYENRLRPIARRLDSGPVLDRNMIAWATYLQQEYFCSFADALATVLPAGLKRLRASVPVASPLTPEVATKDSGKDFSVQIVQDLSLGQRWTFYAELIKKTLARGVSAILLVPDHRKIAPALKGLALESEPIILHSAQHPKENLDAWLRCREQPVSFVIGTRSAVFAPVNNLGCLLVDEEDHFAYRQDQVPHYRVPEVALFRARREKARVILGGFIPSLDTAVRAVQEGWPTMTLADETPRPKVMVFETSFASDFKGQRRVIGKAMEYRLAAALQHREKILVYAGQKGFAPFLYCKRCAKPMTCPRCSVSLHFFQDKKIVACPRCTYRGPSFELCPVCQSAYVRYLGFGSEKICQEIRRFFPSARLSCNDKVPIPTDDYDIMLVTPQFFEEPAWRGVLVDHVYVPDADGMLNHADFRATERAFVKLMKLERLAGKELCLQSRLTDHDVFRYLRDADIRGFFDNELRHRRELNLPPWRPMGVLTVRSASPEKARATAESCFDKLKKVLRAAPDAGVVEPIPAMPFKIRGNYRYQILVKTPTWTPFRKSLLGLIQKPPHEAIITFDPQIP